MTRSVTPKKFARELSDMDEKYKSCFSVVNLHVF